MSIDRYAITVSSMLCEKLLVFSSWPDIKMKPVILTVFEKKNHIVTFSNNIIVTFCD